MRSLLLAALIGVSPAALAQEYDDGLDEQGFETKEPTPKAQRAKPAVREVVKGFYAKSNVGTSLFLAKFSANVRPGTSVALAVGQDFIDNENSSVAWEFDFTQGIHNGMDYEVQSDPSGFNCAGQAPAACLQGDLRTYMATVHLEAAAYPSRRVGVGGRIGGGVFFAPLLMEYSLYQSEVLGGTWGIEDPGYHSYDGNRNPHPVVSAGLEVEYYSKLSHFSVGINADAFYAIGMDLGLNATGFLKYTF